MADESNHGYTCSLGHEDQMRAQKELHEDPRQRLGAVEHLRKWLQEQPHICFPTDTPTLLMYLRHAKFSQLRARDVIESTCKLHAQHPTFFKNYSPLDEEFVNAIKRGFFILLPGRGSKGQKRVLFTPAAFISKKSKKDARVFVRAYLMVCQYMLMDEATQVCGTEWLIDCSGFGLEHQKFFLGDQLKTLTNHQSSTLPMRTACLHHYNVFPVVDVVLGFLRQFMSRKMRQRFTVLGSNMEKVYIHFPENCLPEDYVSDDYQGPHAGSKQALIDDLIRKMQQPEVVKYLGHLSKSEWGIDMGKKLHTDTLPETFRKLSVD